MSAILIMFDGPDGVGKTTQLQQAAESLVSEGYRVWTTRINGGSTIGEALRTVYLSDIERPAATDFYIGQAIYEAFVTEIAKQREAYDIILSDRSPLSNVAYQAYGSGYDKEITVNACRQTLAALRPELLLCYTAPLATLRERLKNAGKGKSDYFESKPDSFFDNVLQGYQELAQEFPVRTIDATTDTDTIHTQTMELIRPLLTSLPRS